MTTPTCQSPSPENMFENLTDLVDSYENIREEVTLDAFGGKVKVRQQSAFHVEDTDQIRQNLFREARVKKPVFEMETKPHPETGEPTEYFKLDPEGQRLTQKDVNGEVVIEKDESGEDVYYIDPLVWSLDQRKAYYKNCADVIRTSIVNSAGELILDNETGEKFLLTLDGTTLTDLSSKILAFNRGTLDLKTGNEITDPEEQKKTASSEE